jgi:hypothetical protein
MTAPHGSVFCASTPMVTGDSNLAHHKITVIVPNGEDGVVSIHLTLEQADRLNRDLADHVEAINYDEARGR